VSALPAFHEYVPDGDPTPAQIDERAAEIDANTDRVIELFHENALWLTSRRRGNGHLELIELSVLLMNAWPVLEKRIAGVPVTQEEAQRIPAVFQKLRPLIDERAVLVREAAEEELQA
jgi:hypothetical protein